MIIDLRYMTQSGLKEAQFVNHPEYKYILQSIQRKTHWNFPTNFSNESSTKYSIENLRYCNINCIHIRIFDISFAFDSDSLPSLSPNISYRAAVF